MPPARSRRVASLFQLVQQLVVRHDHMGAVADEQAARSMPAAVELVHLVEQHVGVHHHAVADHADGLGMEDAGRDEAHA